MKRTLALVLALALMLPLLAGAAAPKDFDNRYFPTWFEEEGTWRTITNDTEGREGGAKGRLYHRQIRRPYGRRPESHAAHGHPRCHQRRTL